MKMTKIFFVMMISFVFIFCAVEYCPAQVDKGKDGGDQAGQLHQNFRPLKIK